MLEDLATLKHVLREPDDWQEMRNATFKHRRQILQDFEKTGQEEPWLGKARAQIEWMRENGATNPGTIKARFLEAQPGEISLYTQYRNLSDQAHAGMCVVVKYTESGIMGPGTFGLSKTGSNESASEKLRDRSDDVADCAPGVGFVLGIRSDCGSTPRDRSATLGAVLRRVTLQSHIHDLFG